MVNWPSGGGAPAIEWSILVWTGATLSDTALAAEIFAASGDLTNMVGSCCSVNGDGRLQLDNEGGYLIHTYAVLGTFTPSANGKFSINTEVRTSGGSLINGNAADEYPVVNGLTSISPRGQVTRVEPVDAGSTHRLTGFQRSGANRSMSAQSRIVYLGDMAYPF
jgi:hypothetical protein